MASFFRIFSFIIWFITASFFRYAYIVFPLIELTNSTLLLIVLITLLALCTFIPFVEQLESFILMPWGLYAILSKSSYDIFDYLYFLTFFTWMIYAINFLVMFILAITEKKSKPSRDAKSKNEIVSSSTDGTNSTTLDPNSAFVTGVFMDCFSNGIDIIKRDSCSKSKTRNYFIIEFNFLLHCTFAGIVSSKETDFSYERLVKFFSITLFPYAKKFWGKDYQTIAQLLLIKRFSDYQKVFFNDYCPIDLLEITEHSPENKFARAFALFVDFCCYYPFSKEIANIEDFSCIPVFDLFETIPLRTLFANLSHVHSHYCDLLCEHYK